MPWVSLSAPARFSRTARRQADRTTVRKHIMEQSDFTNFDFINRANAEYIDLLYQRYQTDPRSVDAYWRAFFAGFEAGGGRQIVGPAGETGPSGYEDLVHAYRELGH